MLDEAHKVMIRWRKWSLVTHQFDIFIVIGHEKKSPIIQNHTVYMLQGKKMNTFKMQYSQAIKLCKI